VTGAFEGTVTNSQTGAPIADATALIINQQTNLVITKQTDSRGRFYQGLLAPGLYTIRVTATGYEPREVVQRLFITRTGEVVPVPVSLDPLPAGAVTPTPTPSTAPTPAPASALTAEDTDIRARINAVDGQRGDSFTEEEISTLPLGGRTIIRTFDELALLLPGVAPPPQTLGSITGPGVGAGVGTAGQFSVNGLRSRANNFTVDGADNNDEDIGVRRQGFVALNSQPIESVKEYQVTTLLSAAQFGRNIGAQVNAVSKSGGKDTHGTAYGFLNASQLNARNPFDTAFGNATTPLRAGNNQAVVVADNITNVPGALADVVNPRPITITNQSGGKDSFTSGQYGFLLGGPVHRPNVFYFVATEGQRINATKEESFAVPTVEQRGAFGTGATGVFRNPLGRRDENGGLLDPVLTFPTTRSGDAIFSLFPFPNNPQGLYGTNTFTQVLPANGRAAILSAKVDGSFHLRGRQQSVTNRYNLSDDRRIIPVTGGALFASLEPRVRTQGNSFFFNSEVSAPNSARPLFNQLRLSYGRTRLNFGEARDSTFQQSSHFPVPFLLNAPLLENTTLPEIFIPPGQQRPEIRANTGPIVYVARPGRTTEDELGPVGQVNIAGFSPVGVDVFNFPQRRVNNTYQVADSLTWRVGAHNYGFGTDMRRTELNSVLPTNARPIITFGGAPRLRLDLDAAGRLANLAISNDFIRPETLAAAGAASGFVQTLTRGADSAINLRYYQLNFYAQDDWRARRNLSLSFSLRYEYNTPPRDTGRRIEQGFNDRSLALIPGLGPFIGDRSGIFDPDRNNFAPRLGIAYSPSYASATHTTVLRAGYGIFYDQILGAVVSQSRNVYPNYLTVDRAGGFANLRFTGNCPEQRGGCPFQLTSPRMTLIEGTPLVQPGTLNTLNPALSFAELVALFNAFGTGGGNLPPLSGFGFTIPQQQLPMPLAHQYDFTLEQQFTRTLALSVAYVGTQGRNLLRFSTPNLGRNSFIAPVTFSGGGFCDGRPCFGDPAFFGLALPPGTRINDQRTALVGGRPISGVGAVNRFETNARSRYDSLQVQLRGRFMRRLQLQAAYTLSKATDDVSDVFDLAGAAALPQNSLTFAGERAPANFDARHRITYNFVYDLPALNGRSALLRAVFSQLQLASVGRFQTGQPFTVNSIFDVNLDGNLTDRLNSTNGLTVTGNRSQPLRLDVRDTSRLLADIGTDGRVGRNTFRAGNILELDLSLVKHLPLTDRQQLVLRMDVFNFINRANYGIPIRFLEAPGFGQASNTVTPSRRIQFALKYSF
jgi:hypothetical protein